MFSVNLRFPNIITIKGWFKEGLGNYPHMYGLQICNIIDLYYYIPYSALPFLFHKIDGRVILVYIIESFTIEKKNNRKK